MGKAAGGPGSCTGAGVTCRRSRRVLRPDLDAGPNAGPDIGPCCPEPRIKREKSVLEPLTARPTSSQARKTAAALPSVFSPVSFTKLSISTSIASTPAPAEGDSPTLFPSSIHQRPHIPVLPANSSHRHGDTRPHILHQSQPYQFPGSSNFFFDKKAAPFYCRRQTLHIAELGGPQRARHPKSNPPSTPEEETTTPPATASAACVSLSRRWTDSVGRAEREKDASLEGRGMAKEQKKKSSSAVAGIEPATSRSRFPWLLAYSRSTTQRLLVCSLLVIGTEAGFVVRCVVGCVLAVVSHSWRPVGVTRLHVRSAVRWLCGM